MENYGLNGWAGGTIDPKRVTANIFRIGSPLRISGKELSFSFSILSFSLRPIKAKPCEGIYSV